jgi:hypothetical protein
MVTAGGAADRESRGAESPPRLWWVIGLSIIAAAAGCSKKAPAPGAAPGATPAAHVSGTPQTGDVIDAMKSAGLPPEGFASLEPVPFGASYCEQGRVQGVDTLICEYADDGSLDRGKQLVHDEWGRENVQTGVTTTTKRTLLAVADRGHHDPNGKTISQILKVFKKL